MDGKLLSGYPYLIYTENMHQDDKLDAHAKKSNAKEDSTAVQSAGNNNSEAGSQGDRSAALE